LRLKGLSFVGRVSNLFFNHRHPIGYMNYSKIYS